MITFSEEAWAALSSRQRIALVDHELMHVSWNEDTDEAVLLPHDLEEFGEIVASHGAWSEDLRQFADAAGIQLPLFAGDLTATH